MDLDAPAHLLSLKVMRVSRPDLANAWQPFYSSSPSFSAHSTASILSLQGTTPLPGYPKTLRDLTHTTQFLTLPSSFGSIQLGEIFSSCLCINNEAHVNIDGVTVKVEMQTASSKIVLADLGGPAYQLAPGHTYESIVTHEIKELGQHVLACTVNYQLPLNLRPPLASAEDGDDAGVQTFRKFYKFAVTNPLSVKTKVHIPRSLAALVSPLERDKVFLEVHIQNLTIGPLHFERMQFECTDNWNVTDTSALANESHERLSGSQALMQPQDMRQYIYILTPKFPSLLPINHLPGSTIPLGRLDIFWRSSFGEPGRLLTSVLSRRVPLLAPVSLPGPPPPSYIKRAITANLPSRPQSPQPSRSRPGTPSNLPGSPQSRPSLLGAVGPTPLPSASPRVSDIEVSLVKREPTPTSVQLEKPFGVSFSLILSTPMQLGKNNQSRTVRLAVQHLQHRRASQTFLPLPSAHSTTLSSRLSSGFSTPSSPQPTPNHDRNVLVDSPRQKYHDEMQGDHQPNDSVTLPPPFFLDTDESSSRRSTGVEFTGSSALFLPPVELSVPEARVDGDVAENVLHGSQDFELSYLPSQKGYTTIGGLRVLLVGDNFGDARKDPIFDGSTNPITLKEWDVIAEVWVWS